MSRAYLKFNMKDNNGLVFEVDDDSVPSATGSETAGLLSNKKTIVSEAPNTFEDALVSVKGCINTLLSQVNDLKKKPDSIEINFGIKVIGEIGIFAVTKLKSDANIDLKISWKMSE